jgi:hypothetical protein
MKNTLLAAALAVVAGLTGMVPRANAAASLSTTFNMVPSAGATCLPSIAHARVTISDLGPVQNLHLEVFSLPPNTSFTTFVIQHPNKPFGLGWYQGDIETDGHGRGVADFRGIFDDETFIVSDSPVQMDHLGIWFADPNDAVKAGCAATVTPFDGDHAAGIQVLNTGNFADDKGPLLNLK